MSASKFALHGIGTVLFRAPRTFSANPTPLLFHKPPPLKTLRIQQSSYSAAADTVTVEKNTNETLSCVDQPLLHPWPEWVSFVDRLKIKGYLTESSSSSAGGGDEFDASTGGAGVTNSSDSVYRNKNLVKNACLSFARDRYDVFKSLSEENIRTVVKSGCPSLLRKVVNSAKRLRAHVRLDEGDVCSTCNLRGTCDRAYVILKEPEQAGRTMDIVRILLHHALDPIVISGGEKPPGIEDIELSARKLLSELIELSESSIAPAPPKLPAKQGPLKDKSLARTTDRALPNIDAMPGRWTCPKCNVVNFSGDMHCPKCFTPITPNLKRVTHTNEVVGEEKAFERKKGDWDCPKCRFVNFSRNKSCLKCKTEGPKRVSADEVERKKGDWDCPRCSFVNFSRNKRCLKCETEGPKRDSADEVERKKGDWDCPRCSFVNFSRNKRCLKCETEGPKRDSADEVERKKGDWDCPRCGFLNFAANNKCLKCPEPRPKGRNGEWNCPKCDFLNFQKNKLCLRCNTQRPLEQVGAGIEYDAWIRPT